MVGVILGINLKWIQTGFLTQERVVVCCCLLYTFACVHVALPKDVIITVQGAFPLLISEGGVSVLSPQNKGSETQYAPAENCGLGLRKSSNTVL